MPTATLTRPTRKQYVDYMGTLKGAYGPGRGLSNNDNPFNTWYYGRRVSGNNYAWCAVTECYVENHFNILTINGGKVAYVPNMVSVAHRAGAKVWHKPGSVPKQGTSWAKPGNKLCYDFNHTGEAEHTGTFIKRLSSTTFLAREGNTASGKGSDVLDDKIRSVHDVLDCIELLGVADVATTTPTEEVLKTLLDLGAEQSQTIKAGKRGSLGYELEYTGGDPSKIHSDAKAGERFPSLFPTGGDAPYGVTATVKLSTPPKPGVKLAISQYERDTNTHERDIRTQGLVAPDDVLHANVRMSDKHKYRVDLINDSDQDVVVEKAYLLIVH
jgi:hypothetical protein